MRNEELSNSKFLQRIMVLEPIRIQKTPEQHVATAEQLAKENDDVLPSPFELQKMGHGDLVGCMKNHKELFSHITQEKKIKTPEQHVATAEQLAKENDDVLPSSSELREMGHSDLVGCMKNHKELFSHITQEKKLKTKEQHVALAEQLAKENDDVLPGPSELREMGHGDLVTYMHKYKRFFAHITQEKTYKTKEQHVTTAERLAKENDGLLPSVNELKGMGYGDLVRCMYNHKKSFAHIPQKKKKNEST